MGWDSLAALAAGRLAWLLVGCDDGVEVLLGWDAVGRGGGDAAP